jgi:hypothetical protein
LVALRSVRVGRENRFAFGPEPIDELRAYLDRVSTHWDNALGRLKSLVES